MAFGLRIYPITCRADEPQKPPEPRSPPKIPISPLPILYENFAKEWTQISSQDNYDGLRVEAVKTVTPALQATHSLFLGTTMYQTGYGYQFGPSYASDDGRFTMMARYGIDGNLSLRALRRLGSFAELSFNTNSSLNDKQKNMHEISLTTYGGVHDISSMGSFRGNKTLWNRFLTSLPIVGESYSSCVVSPDKHDTSSLDAVLVDNASPNPLSRKKTREDRVSCNGWAASLKMAYQGTLITNLSFSQEILPRICMGADYTHIAVNNLTIASVGARYVLSNQLYHNIISAVLTRQPDMNGGPFTSSHSGKIQFVRKVSDRLSLGVELDISHHPKSSHMGFRGMRIGSKADDSSNHSRFKELPNETHFQNPRSVKSSIVRRITSEMSRRMNTAQHIVTRKAIGASQLVKSFLGNMESSLRVGYEYSFNHCRIQGCIDTSGAISACVQDFTGFGFSGSVDFFKSIYRFGFMLHVVPQPEENR